MDKPLRILAIVNLPWNPRLGAARVWFELSEQWKAAGHKIDKFCLSDAYPNATTSPARFAWRQAIFPYRAARYVREHADEFDVIDCLIGTLPFSKKSLGFSGVLVGRSIGLYLTYAEFIRSSRKRWRDQPRGKILGRLLYSFTSWLLRRSADRALGYCDLFNVPNADEKRVLESRCPDAAIIVEPYGLNEAERAAFIKAARSTEERLAHKEVCFVGTWDLRKGSRDWPEIVRAVRKIVPDARFAFLGTMTDEQTVLHDLGLPPTESIRCVSTYDPKELPELLGRCAVGVFPSYVEGFGLAILEQLAAGIPTIAYDVPGPRQILESFGKAALVPAGETAKLAALAAEVVSSDAISYELRRKQCLTIAGQFSWPKVADATLRAYRRALDTTGAIIFTQPFGLCSPNGGARIMRALLQESAFRFVSVATSPERPPPTNIGRELHVPLRPSFGRIDRTRLAKLAIAVSPLFASHFSRKLEAVCRQNGAFAIHSIAHGGLDFYTGFRVAKKLNVPFFLQVHDDFIFSARGVRNQAAAHSALAEAWKEAAERFVICRALGQEYCRRYGERDYVVITDGSQNIAAAPRPRLAGNLNVYFMGLFHLEYEPNLKLLVSALADLQKEGHGDRVSITLRCGGIRPQSVAGCESFVRVLPFASEAAIESEIRQADLLYLPLPFESKYELFVRFSLSTKLVTYLASGVPILYHGPPEAAVYDLLRAHNAALLCTRPGLQDLLGILREYIRDPAIGMDLARNALDLAASDFMLKEIRLKFWESIAKKVAN